MILILSGTRDGRNLIALLSNAGYKVMAFATSEYGQELALQDGAAEVATGVVTEEQFSALLESQYITAVVDATHAVPGNFGQNAAKVCGDRGICYIRFVREEVNLAEHPLIYPVYSYEEAAEKAAELGQTIFLTTGSYNLEAFLACRKNQNKRLVVRVLPEHRVIAGCRQLGISPRDIVAMQGPFSRELNKALFKAYKANVVVMKDSGKAGGTDTKISAALSLKIPVVVIKRQADKYPHQVYSYEEVLALLRENGISC